MDESRLRVAPGVLQAISAHAHAEAPRECCGLLIGSNGRIDEVLPAGNCAGDPLRRYEIDPRTYIAAIIRCRGTSSEVLGAYHSHPRSPAEPSPTDLAEAFGDFLYVIAGPVTAGSTATIRAFRFMDGNFRPVELVPDPQGPRP